MASVLIIPAFAALAFLVSTIAQQQTPEIHDPRAAAVSKDGQAVEPAPHGAPIADPQPPPTADTGSGPSSVDTAPAAAAPASAAIREPAGAAGRAPSAPAVRSDGSLPARRKFEGTLTVDATLAGARVYVDERLIGVTPLADIVVQAGSHVVRVELDGYSRWSSVVQVVTDGNTSVAATLNPIERDRP